MFARTVSSCVNVLTHLKQFNYVGDLNSEGDLGSATRKLTLDIKIKWLNYVKEMDLYHPGPAVFSELLHDMCKMNCFCPRSRATKKKPKAPPLQHQKQAQRRII